MPSVYLGIGSNIDPVENIKAAVTLLRDHFPEAPIAFSSVFTAKPRECEDQADFLNAVAMFETEHEPDVLYRRLNAIEKLLRKQTPFRYGPRTIDIDLLLYSDMVLVSPTLILPHPRMHERRFVLEPLVELVDVNHPHPRLKKTWKELLEEVQQQEVEKTDIVL